MNEERGTREDESFEMLKSANPVQEPDGNDLRARRVFAAAAGDSRPGRRRWYGLAAASGALAVVVALVIGAVALSGGGGDGRGGDDGGTAVDNPDDPGGGFAATCLGFTEDELRRREFAFAGTVTAIDGSLVTFGVDEWLNGDGGSTVTLELDSTLQNSMYTEFTVSEGARYLVSGDEQFAWGCGFTVPYEESAAQQWRAVLAVGATGEERSVDVGGTVAASCAFPYSLDTLAERDYAFDGTVTAVERAQPSSDDGDEPELLYDSVTFTINEQFSGSWGDTVTLRVLSGMAGYGSDERIDTLNVGDRYLVSGDEDFVWACGFTKTYADSTADQWRAATR